MLQRRQFIALGVMATASLLFHPLAVSAADGDFFVRNGAAIGGTDPVAYFTQNKPVAGSPQISAQWQGVTWRFSSEENKKKFLRSPEAYAPQFGGFCAFGAASGYLVSTEPEAWTIRNGKLYLNYSIGVRTKWLADVENKIVLANKNWPSLRP